MKRHATPAISIQLWDTLGNSCRAEIYFLGDGKFELFQTDFNESVPIRHLGTLGELQARLDLWISLKNQAGFPSAETFPTPAPIN